MAHSFTISASLEIQKEGICFLNAKRVELLKRIGSTGSMLAASKEMGMSYQQAWTYVQQMNLISPLPLVIRKRGGSNGGGAELTRFGQKIIERYYQLEINHREQTDRLAEDLILCLF